MTGEGCADSKKPPKTMPLLVLERGCTDEGAVSEGPLDIVLKCGRGASGKRLLG